MDKCKCVGCGKILSGDDSVWVIRRFIIFNGKLETVFSPCCSEVCGGKAKQENLQGLNRIIDRLREIAEDVDSFKPVCTTVAKYPDF